VLTRERNCSLAHSVHGGDGHGAGSLGTRHSYTPTRKRFAPRMTSRSPRWLLVDAFARHRVDYRHQRLFQQHLVDARADTDSAGQLAQRAHDAVVAPP